MIRNCRECDEEFNTESYDLSEGGKLCPTCRQAAITQAACERASDLLETLDDLTAAVASLSLYTTGTMRDFALGKYDKGHALLAAIRSKAESLPEPTDPYLAERSREQQDLFAERQQEVAE